MTGYIRPVPAELKLREYQYYRGAYCGLCHTYGRCTGQCSRITLSYDMVFLVLLRLALTNGNPCDEQTPDRSVTFSRKRCLRHPLFPRLCLDDGDATRHAACVAAVLNDYKLSDDRADEHGWKRLRAGLLAPAFRRMSRRAERWETGLLSLAEQGMKTVSDAERQDDFASADRPAQAFGELLAALFAYGLKTEYATLTADHIGVHLGRWLYLIDAVDDYAEDVRRGRFNALYRLYGLPQLPQETRAELMPVLLDELRQCKDALDLLEIDRERCGRELQPLLYHMFDEALPHVTRQVLLSPNHKRKGKRNIRVDFES